MVNRIIFETRSEFCTKEALKKLKKIKKYARKMEKLAKDIEELDRKQEEVQQIETSKDSIFELRKVRYGIKIKKNEEDPKKRVTYIYDAEGMTPAAMDYDKGRFNYGSWYGLGFATPWNNYPCMLNYDGTEAYKLNPDNYALKEDGTESDIENVNFTGNAMAAFIGGYLAQYEDEEYEYIIWSNAKYDEKYNCFHRMDEQGKETKGFYYRIFTPVDIENKARSLSDFQPMRHNTAFDEMEKIEANGKKWTGLTWSRYNYIISLLMIMGKTEDIRSAYGTGNSIYSWSENNQILESGRLNKKGAFYGTRDRKEQMKVFHIEALWGNQFTRCIGLIAKEGNILVKPYGPYNFTGEGYETMAEVERFEIKHGFVDRTEMTKYGRVARGFNGKEDTYTCNYAAIDTYGETEIAIIGGAAHNGESCGFLVALNNVAHHASKSIAPGLSCEMPLKE